MKLAGLLLLVAGWGIAIFAIALLPSTVARAAFVLAGLATETLGLGLLIRSHVVLDVEREQP
ncbi:MAG: hypothetical protein WCC04_15105 [Terriglobales bacterium]